MFNLTRYTVIGITILIIIALGGLYFYLRGQQDSAKKLSDARGLTTETPSFFGSGGSTEANNARTPNSAAQSGKGGGRPPRLWQVSSAATAGAAFFGNGTTTALYFVDRATGHVIMADLQSGEKVRLTNTLYPHVVEALFAGTSTVALRSYGAGGRVETYLGKIQLATSTTEGMLSGSDLPVNIVSISASESGASIFYLQPNSSGGVDGIVANSDSTKPKHIFTSPLSDWRAEWPSKDRIVLVQNASDNIPGNAYALTTTGVISTIIEDVPGLSIKAAPTSAFLYSSSLGSAVNLFSVRVPDSVPVGIEVSTLAEKCAWDPSGTVAYCATPANIPRSYMGSWYRGAIHTSDTLSRVNTETGATETVVSFENQFNVPIDVAYPSVSKDGAYISFTDLKDGSLWVYRFAP